MAPLRTLPTKEELERQRANKEKKAEERRVQEKEAAERKSREREEREKELVVLEKQWSELKPAAESTKSELTKLQEESASVRKALRECLTEMDVASKKAETNEQQLLLYKTQYEAENRVFNQPEDQKEQDRLKAEEENLTKAVKNMEQDLNAKLKKVNECVEYETSVANADGGRLKEKIIVMLQSEMNSLVDKPRGDKNETNVGPLEIKGVRWQSCRILFPAAQTREGTTMEQLKKDEIFSKDWKNIFKCNIPTRDLNLFLETRVPPIMTSEGDLVQYQSLKILYNGDTEKLHLKGSLSFKRVASELGREFRKQ